MPPSPLIARPRGGLAGTVRVPGDRSMSHRALILGALAVGRTSIKGLADSAEVRATVTAVAALGATVTRHDDGLWTVDGVGIGGLAEPAQVLDLGSSGTALRLLIGLAATHPITALFTGGPSLVRRPLARILQPLELMGAEFTGRHGGLLPLAVTGAGLPMPIDYRLPTASAEMKSAILMAALNTPGTTIVQEPHPTRDHTERMLAQFGARVTVGPGRVEVEGQPELVPATLHLPADLSLAAYPLVAALMVEGSEVTLADVGLNPRRLGLVTVLREMGAALDVTKAEERGGEPVGDLRVRASRLTGVTIPAARVPDLRDDYPILAIAAAHAAGVTVLGGLGGLAAGETERLTVAARGLAAAGVRVEQDDDTLTIHGTGGAVPGGVGVSVGQDRRLAIAFLILGLAAKAPIAIHDGAMIETGFPDFAALMRGLGADISAGTI